MQQSKPWHEDDTFWETWGPIMFSGRALASAVAQVEKIIPLLDVKPSARILDLGCGVGRHSLELARHGFQVTGVDRTEHYLEQASEKAKKEELEVKFIQDDMRDFCQPNSFHVAISMGTSFSYFEDPEEDRQVLANVYRSLMSGGVFLLDMHGKETLSRIFVERDWYEEDDVLVLHERTVSQNWSWMELRWILLKDNKRAESRLSHRLYAATELIALLTDCGFAQVDLYGDLEGVPYDQNAKRMVVVGRK